MNYYRDEPSDPLSSNSESFKYNTTITENIHNLVAGNANYNATKVGKKWNWSFYSFKIFKQFLENI